MKNIYQYLNEAYGMKRSLFCLVSIIIFFSFSTTVGMGEEKRSTGRGWLGVAVQDITPELAKAFGIKEGYGALVSEVMDNSPAKEAGFGAGDIITEFDKKAVKYAISLQNLVRNTQIGETIPVKIIRSGTAFYLAVTIQGLPDIGSETPKTSTSIVPKEDKEPTEEIKIPDALGEL